MIIEAKFKNTLISMMETMPLEEINVTALCEKCKCHRQTFYYHYQDIYDLIADIFLNETIEAMDKAKDPKKAISAFLTYAKGNFNFLKSTYNSAARDLTDDFIYSKIYSRLLAIWSNDPKINLSSAGVRDLARRYSRLFADECGYWLKDQKITAERFSRHLNKFVDNSFSTVLPALMDLSKKEESK